jgi:hypothetical protein
VRASARLSHSRATPSMQVLAPHLWKSIVGPVRASPIGASKVVAVDSPSAKNLYVNVYGTVVAVDAPRLSSACQMS